MCVCFVPDRPRLRRSEVHAIPQWFAPNQPGTVVPSLRRSGRVLRIDRSQRSRIQESCSLRQHTVRSRQKR